MQWGGGRSSCALPRPRRPRVAAPPLGWGVLGLLTMRRGCPAVRGKVWLLLLGMRRGRVCRVPGSLLTGPCPIGGSGIALGQEHFPHQLHGWGPVDQVEAVA
eukprot:6435139-Pyramimonas_sp.AAC.1